MRPLLLALLALPLLLTSQCRPARPASASNIDPTTPALDAPAWLRAVPTELSPRKWRKAVRTAGKAQARVIAAAVPQPAAAPLLAIASGNVKTKADQRGSAGGTYAPGKQKAKTRTINKQGQRAAGGVAIGDGASATGATKLTTPWWLWLLLGIVVGWLVRRFWPG